MAAADTARRRIDADEIAIVEDACTLATANAVAAGRRVAAAELANVEARGALAEAKAADEDDSVVAPLMARVDETAETYWLEWQQHEAMLDDEARKTDSFFALARAFATRNISAETQMLTVLLSGFADDQR